MPTRDYAEPAWRDYGQVIVVDDIDEAYRVADASPSSTSRCSPPSRGEALDRDAQLRGAVPGREHLRLLRRQGDRHQPRAAHPRRGALHRRTLGRQVPQAPSPTRRSSTTPPAASWAGSAAGRRGSSSSRATPAPATSAPAATSVTGSTGWTRRWADSAAAPTATHELWRAGPRWSPAGVSGLGAAIGRALHADGRRRWSLAGRRAEPLQQLAAELGERAEWRVCDVADPESVTALADSLAGTEVSIVINNAGVAGPVSPLTDDRPCGVGRGVRRSTSAASSWSAGRSCRAWSTVVRGDVINLASVSGKRPLIRRTPYCASKMAVIGLTSTLAFEVGPARGEREQPLPRPGRGCADGPQLPSGGRADRRVRTSRRADLRLPRRPGPDGDRGGGRRGRRGHAGDARACAGPTSICRPAWWPDVPRAEVAGSWRRPAARRAAADAGRGTGRDVRGGRLRLRASSTASTAGGRIALLGSHVAVAGGPRHARSWSGWDRQEPANGPAGARRGRRGDRRAACRHRRCRPARWSTSAHYPPLGQRGFATYGRTGPFRAGRPAGAPWPGRAHDLGDRHGRVAARRGNAAADILRVPGLDGTMVGPADLRMSSTPEDLRPGRGDRRVHAALAAAARCGWTSCNGTRPARRSLAAGAQLVVYNLTHAIMEQLAALRRAGDRRRRD